MDERSPHQTASQRPNYDRAMHNLVEHVKVLSADTRELLRQSAGQTGEQLGRLRDRTLQSLSALETRLGPLQQVVSERARFAFDASTQHVRRHPLSTIAAAGAIILAVTAVLAWQNEQSRDQSSDER